MAALTAVAFVPYAGLVSVRPEWIDVRVVLPLAATVGVVLAFSPPVMSDDVFRYGWDGLVASHGISPYAFTPDDPSLAFLRDEAWEQINHRKIATVYPPMAQLVFAVVVAAARWLAISPILLLKLVATGVHLLTGVVLARAFNAKRGAALLLLNPLVLVESSQSGHVDGWVGLSLLLFVLAVGRGRTTRALGFAALAVGIKLVGVLCIPLLLRIRRGAAVALLLVVALCAAFLAAAGQESQAGVQAGLAHYAIRWEGNAGPFRLLQGGAGFVLDCAGQVAGWPPGQVHGTAVDQRLLPFRAGADSLSAGNRKKGAGQSGSEFASRSRWADMVARGWALLLLAAVAFQSARKLPVAEALRLTVLVALLLSPTVHPWYLLWLLPLEVLTTRRAGLLWSVLILLSYAPLERYRHDGVWEAHDWVTALQYLALVGAVAWEEGGMFFGAASRASPSRG